MSNLIPDQKTALILKSPREIEEICHLKEGWLATEVPSGFLPELWPIYRIVKDMDDSTRCYSNFDFSPEHVNWFVQSELFVNTCEMLKHDKYANEEDATLGIKTILSTTPINNNIDPELLAETFIEIVRELRPTKLALHFTRISVRNNFTFAPSPKEFRNTLIDAMGSLANLNILTSHLPEKAKEQRHISDRPVGNRLSWSPEEFHLTSPGRCQ